MSQDTTRDDAFLADWDVHTTFGAVPGTNGVDRQAATEADGQQRRWFASLMQKHGMTVLRDEIGNQFGLLELVPGAPYVLTGSHMDSQPTAGRFDGAYGVMASAHAAFRLGEHFASNPGEAACNIAVVNWFNEEGSRFKPSMMGSGVFTGKLGLDEALETRDKQGVTVREALDAIGERGDGPVELDLAAYAEIHVEQGRSMDEDGVTIGLVSATWAAHKYELRIRGEQAHSGSALMADRRDALLAAAKLIVAARELVDDYDEGALHTAVGEITVYPNSPVVVASEARILLDLRSPSMEVIDSAAKKLQATMAEVEESVGVEIDIVHEHAWDQNPYQPEGTALARSVAEALGLSHGEVLTVAGHDSTNMKDHVPTVMLFVPSVEGISHNLNEFTKDEDLLAGLDHLTEVLRRIVTDPSVVAGASGV
ncbi:M20 family metallo-hydrolase [Brevibacterium luteolum]|uniref:Zn-dependent hydrolase n=1 Tax=Brevibacterium luteolum TaxID=199591 RepID=A0A2N6PHY6_9MICO|nr:M20 family metallo-hydrolase [Brevibacterium luteolum]MCT1873625.1 M20 family metallo-hydrolase [Brevibacterium luteolum]MCT1892425.1 M20 family metallo-hydrolase [Brevibacterium luteolum]PMB98291.1 Zn-dependent hydrolase [Brevibacterium luteolum]